MPAVATKAAFTEQEWDLVRAAPPAAGMLASKPKSDRVKARSVEELTEQTLQRLGDAVATVSAKATPAEVDDYRRFIATLTERVARRHKEDDVEVSQAEQRAIDDVRAALGGSAGR